MYSGGDSSGDGVNSHNQFNWQMTSQTSCNVNSGSIDWASLAQQWIQMKDSGTGLPEAPPPPIISNVNSINKKEPTIAKFDEQGEADMEVEKEDEEQMFGFDHNTPPPPPMANRWIPITKQQEVESYCPPQQNWTWPARVALPPPILHVPLITGSLTPPINSTTPPLQKPQHVEMAAMLSTKSINENVPMDAAKRKILPAWIREGLEKMEREKLKQMERGTKDKDPSNAGTPAVDESDIKNIKSMVKSSIMEMEGESSGNEDVNTTADPEYDDTDGETTSAHPATNMSTSNDDVSQNLYNSGKTYEERIADMMIGVRKTLTELLLEVTNEEIVIIANEAIRRRREKASSVQVIRKSAIPSITGKLGLEAYADSDSENSASDNDTTNDDSKRSDDDYDSEEELKANIRICQRAFMKTIEEIEDKIEASAVRDEYLLREHRKDENNLKKDAPVSVSETVGKTSPVMQQQKSKRFDKEIGEPLQPDKSKSNTNGKRRKERTSRFSDNKDSKNRNVGTSFYQPPPAMGSGSIPSQSMPGSLTAPSPASNFPVGEFRPRAGASSVASSPPEHEKRSSSSSTRKSSKQPSSSSSAHNSRRHNRHRHSDSSTSSTESTSSSTSSSHSRRSRRYSRERSKHSSHKSSSHHRSSSHRSSSHRSSRRRDSSDSNDDDRYSKRSSHGRRTHKSSHSSSKHSNRSDHRRRRSDSRSSRSRTRSRSRSRSTTYGSSRR